jgi:hypothetical protein
MIKQVNTRLFYCSRGVMPRSDGLRPDDRAVRPRIADDLRRARRTPLLFVRLRRTV